MMIFPKGDYHNIYKKIQTGDISLMVTNEIINEYTEILERFYSGKVAEYIINAIISLPKTKIINSIYYKWELITADKDDNKFVDAHIISNADYIVTNDRHFDVLKNIDFPSVNIISLDDFLVITDQIF